MGMVITEIKICGPKGAKDLKLIVDTGATFTKIPFSIANELGIEWKSEIEVELSDGTIKQRKLGTAEIEVDGVRREVPITVAEDEQRSFLGYTALEILCLKVNPVTQRLEKTTAIEY